MSSKRNRSGKGVEQDYAKAVEYYTLATEQGEPAGMFCLGECCYLGQGLEKNMDKAAAAAVWLASTPGH